jgi:FKBP-type peptidyl-prolyl cis-trans isomerase
MSLATTNQSTKFHTKTDRVTNFKTIRLGDLTNFPKKGSKVKVHYDVFLLNTKKKIESSRDEKEPFEFMLGRDEVIEAWEDVMSGMSIG